MADLPVTRRNFIRMGAGAAALAASGFSILEPDPLFGATQKSPSSNPIRFASIGTGVRGCQLIQSSLSIPSISCVAVSDLYDGRLTAAREYLKSDVPVSKDYRSILDRKDVDAVIVAVPDHRHSRIVQDAFAAGKDVYCEKPMSHTVEQGFEMVAAAQKNSSILQVGSQRVSSALYAKAKEIYDSGKLGDVCAIDAHTDRNSASGAWVYPVPPDASEQTIDWKAFLGDAPQRPFDAARFFRWRCFTDYGEGLAGDLFVHLTSGIHFVAGINAPPQRALSSGGVFRWKDGRDYPDLLETIYEYPNLRVSLRCNQNNDAGETVTFYGTKGTMVIAGSTVTYKPQDATQQPEGYSIIGWPAKLRNEYLADWRAQHPSPPLYQISADPQGESFAVPPHYDDTAAHETRFFEAVATRNAPVENEVFGNHTAISCHMANYSYFKQTVAVWNPQTRQIESK
jgi:predicted dehydrogenase